jgi:hypothetical protein
MKKIAFLVVGLIFLTACTKGKYPTKHGIWYDAQTSTDFESFGITSVKLLIDSKEVAELETHKYFSNPDCGTGNYSYETSMFKKEARTHSYELRTLSDSIIFKGAFQMIQGKCKNTQLSFQ